MYEYLFHISVLGSENVGKKTLAKSRFLKNPSNVDFMLTIGVEFSSKTVEIYETKVKLLFRIFSRKQYFWDKTQKVNLEILVRRSHGAVILYDITNPKTLEQVPRWIQIVKDNAGVVPILLVGNKLDLEEQREISKEQVEKIKEDHHISSAMEISVKTGENVEKMFLNLARMILNSNKMQDKDRNDVDEYKKRMEKLKKTIISNTRETYRSEKVIYGYVLLIRNCHDLLKNPDLPSDKDLLQKNIVIAYKGIYEELKKQMFNPNRPKYTRITREERSNIYHSLESMRIILGAENTEQFYKTYNIEALVSLSPPISDKEAKVYIVIAVILFIIFAAPLVVAFFLYFF